jgi:hypothetical protein
MVHRSHPVPPLGKKVTMQGVHVIPIANGKVNEHWGSNADLVPHTEIGAIPDPTMHNRRLALQMRECAMRDLP